MREPYAWGIVLGCVLVVAASIVVSETISGSVSLDEVEHRLVLLLLVAASVHDLHSRIVPNAYAIAIALAHAVTLFASVSDVITWASSLGGFLVLGVGSLLFTLAFEHATGKEGIGGADIKLLAALGFTLGAIQGLYGLFAACALLVAFEQIRKVVGGVSCLVRRMKRPGARAGTSYPFVPFLLLGTMPCLL